MRLWGLVCCLLMGCAAEPVDVRLEQLGPVDGPRLSEAVAAVITFEGQTDTLTSFRGPATLLFSNRAGDAGHVRTGDRWQPFEIRQVWDAEDWDGDVWKRVELGQFPDSLWLAGRFGATAIRLSTGSGCWCLTADTLHTAPAEQGEVLHLHWTQGPWGAPMAGAFDLAVRWGDEDQLMPVFWRAVERWGVGAKWRMVCPSREAFGAKGLPNQGLPAHVPVVFEASVSR